MAVTKQESLDRILAFCVVVSMHLAFAWLLSTSNRAPDTVNEDAVLHVEFVRRRDTATRPTHAARAVVPASRPDVPRVAVDAGRPQPLARAEAEPASVLATAGTATAPLDLTLPPSDASPIPSRPFEREPVIETRTTRFARYWAPEGTVIDQARFRSPMVDAALGLFGRPPRHCTEVQRRLREPDCLPLHGAEADEEAIRREIDDRSRK